MVRLSHPYMTTRKNIALTTQTFVVKVMSLLFNTLSRFVVTFVPRSECLLISWLQSPSIEILEPKKIKFVTASTFSLLFAIKWISSHISPHRLSFRIPRACITENSVCQDVHKYGFPCGPFLLLVTEVKETYTSNPEGTRAALKTSGKQNYTSSLHPLPEAPAFYCHPSINLGSSLMSLWNTQHPPTHTHTLGLTSLWIKLCSYFTDFIIEVTSVFICQVNTKETGIVKINTCT